ncbi:hypothetical protein HanRHA438_Chr09g0404081 [Helianthus annuus]|nr:hypothetical protein HanIR_Chr09g0423191 [Helianthus annuus]KAJ0888629.1 hypothetical protein HanRHA438_Chr09g0404081 [Helianthus annuus]
MSLTDDGSGSVTVFMFLFGLTEETKWPLKLTEVPSVSWSSWPVVSSGRENTSKAYLDRPLVVKIIVVAGAADIELMVMKTDKMIRLMGFMIRV